MFCCVTVYSKLFAHVIRVHMVHIMKNSHNLRVSGFFLFYIRSLFSCSPYSSFSMYLNGGKHGWPPGSDQQLIHWNVSVSFSLPFAFSLCLPSLSLLSNSSLAWMTNETVVAGLSLAQCHLISQSASSKHCIIIIIIIITSGQSNLT